MGIRQTQMMGLHDRAVDMLEMGLVHCCVEEVTRTYPDGRIERERREITEPATRTEESGDVVTGMFGEPYPLHRHRLPDGRVLVEAVQHETWSSGPVIHLALRRSDGTWEPGSLWPAEELEGTPEHEAAAQQAR